MLSNNLEQTLRKALLIATNLKHEYATYEHLLLAIIDDEDAKQILMENSSAIEFLKSRLKKYVENDLVDLVAEGGGEAKPTAGFQRIIQRAALHSQAHGQRIITGAHVMAEFFFEHESFALQCLKEANLTRQDIINYIKKTSFTNKNEDKEPRITFTRSQLNKEEKVSDIPEKEVEVEDNLEKYCINLNTRADKDAIDCLVGRKNEIQRTIEILCRRKKNNAILIGEPGVGKTAIAEGLATRIVNKDVPPILKNAIIYSLDVGTLVAGTKFRGDFEERIKLLLESLRKNPDAILFIDEIHTMVGAGSTNAGAMDASNLLKPALAKGELRCIGSTTFKEYHNNFEKDMALVRRFQKIVITEPDEEQTIEILHGLKGYYEKHHNVKYSDESIKAAVELSQRYINDRHLPDKAIDLIDEVGARSKMLNKNKKNVTIKEKDIEDLLTSIINVPSIRSDVSDINHLKGLASNLKEYIFGQDEAIDSLCSSIKLSMAGLKKGSKPTGCYMFAGPTGVGKTELAKQIALQNNMKLIKLDMSEFSEPSSSSKLLGSAPGYVGFDQGGMLTDEVDKFPYSVVLFDEIEKANSEIHNLLLQIMDEGVLTDSTGKHINFSHTIIIMTTNLVAQVKKSSMGFSSADKKKQVVPEMDMSAFNEHFKPEFRSRLDQIILFNPIENIIDKIVSKNIKELASQLADKKVRIKTTIAVRKHFAENCFTNKTGARELSQAMDSELKQNIADEILFGKLKNGGVVSVDFDKKSQELIFKFSKLSKKDQKQLETS